MAVVVFLGLEVVLIVVEDVFLFCSGLNVERFVCGWDEVVAVFVVEALVVFLCTNFALLWLKVVVDSVTVIVFDVVEERWGSPLIGGLLSTQGFVGVVLSFRTDGLGLTRGFLVVLFLAGLVFVNLNRGLILARNFGNAVVVEVMVDLLVSRKGVLVKTWCFVVISSVGVVVVAAVVSVDFNVVVDVVAITVVVGGGVVDDFVVSVIVAATFVVDVVSIFVDDIMFAVVVSIGCGNDAVVFVVAVVFVTVVLCVVVVFVLNLRNGG